MASTGSNPRRERRFFDRGLWEEAGQATVEYLLVCLVLIALVCALAALWHFIAAGGLDRLVKLQASHAVETVGGMLDVVLF